MRSSRFLIATIFSLIGFNLAGVSEPTTLETIKEDPKEYENAQANPNSS